MKIIMIAASLPPMPAGGAEVQALRLAAALEKRNITVNFLTPGRVDQKGEAILNGIYIQRLFSFPNRLFAFFSKLKKKQDPLSHKIEYDDRLELTDQITSKISWPSLVFYHLFFLNSLLFLWPRRRSFDIIHAHTMEWSVIVASRLGKILSKPVVVKDSTMNGLMSIRRFPGGHRLQKMVIKRCTFVAMTKAIEDNLKVAGVPLSKIFRISNGIEVTNESDQTFQQIRFPTVLFVGNLYQQPAKGIDILLKAWCIVGRKHPNAELNIIGDGNLASFIHFTKKLGLEQSVHFLGKLSQLEHYYRKSSIFVLPSRREGMSNALMEAMLHGLPCVATDISGSRELIDHGSNGLLVPPKDIDALATAINYMISNPDEAALMGRLGRRKIIEEFNMDIICTQYVSLYKSLMT